MFPILDFKGFPQFPDPREREWWSSEFWRNEHPLGLEGLSQATIGVKDLDAAGRFYEDILGGKLIHQEHNPARQTESLFFAIADTAIELTKPSAGSDIGRYMEEHGIYYAFTFKVKELGPAITHIKSQNMEPLTKGTDTVELNPIDAYGGFIAFTDRSIPGHPKLQ